MSEERHIVHVNKEKLNFEEFYDKYLNEDNKFELSYCSTDGGKTVDPELQKEIKSEIIDCYNEAIEDNFATSNTFFHIRRFVWALIEYTTSKGNLVKVRSISGWEPQLVILESEEESDKGSKK